MRPWPGLYLSCLRDVASPCDRPEESPNSQRVNETRKDELGQSSNGSAGKHCICWLAGGGAICALRTGPKLLRDAHAQGS
mmetsp:Transcript_121918/g.215771  ORF Transcript_121918/g.215771 Transcript_121918/m.215771 type:complete len:80 (-) Transcript_121918:978-1217(-)